MQSNKGNLGNSISGLYRELETANFKTLPLNSSDVVLSNKDEVKIQNWTRKTNLSPVLKTPKKSENQFIVFQKAMKTMLTCGQALGINPFIGVWETDVSKIRFTYFSWRCLYSILFGCIQAIAAVLCFSRLFRNSISISVLGYFTFYSTTFFTTFIFIRIASKWPSLLKELYESALEEYVDPNIKLKCNLATVALIITALLEHILAIIAKLSQIIECKQTDIYQEHIIKNFPWIFELGLPFYFPMGILLQFISIASALNWNFSDIFVICISMYLASILEQINKKILSACNQVPIVPVHVVPEIFWLDHNLFDMIRVKRQMSPLFWRALREDYTCATQLVRSFDDAISGVVLISFASNLFFICLQLFNVLVNGVSNRHVYDEKSCPNKGNSPFTGYEYSVYFIFSVSLLLFRFLMVSIVAGSVHSFSLVPAQALYNVPSSAYCDEVQRFLDQLHGDNVALSGLKFFYVTKELVLTVAGTIVTYELVLLQFSNEEMKRE